VHNTLYIQTNTAGSDGGGVFNRGTMILENGAVIDSNESANGGGAFNAWCELKGRVSER